MGTKSILKEEVMELQHNVIMKRVTTKTKGRFGIKTVLIQNHDDGSSDYMILPKECNNLTYNNFSEAKPYIPEIINDIENGINIFNIIKTIRTMKGFKITDIIAYDEINRNANDEQIFDRLLITTEIPVLIKGEFTNDFISLRIKLRINSNLNCEWRTSKIDREIEGTRTEWFKDMHFAKIEKGNIFDMMSYLYKVHNDKVDFVKV